ncbi:MAG: bifunctional 4-hydroxy-2-oxoglutarate aldolase/2-dehydro-3-deoxy-phosphogluconate aldolase [Propionibacteriaceae bacterium]|jgi:2-dehydro-3-deoxyphosphogluconate aldolase/(4S)-4-hydroxy-2-oxoglutarate aldolase|nr:bifunctional 4-hydroxy-2-oxoglutarate aldolase/2-dehydro-3-deoxy-phosphogluconate aldolase [Propionibacteriaceae bacterium]
MVDVALLREARIIPVVALHDAADAVPLARALLAGGLPVIEVTFRTAAAAEAIRQMATVPGVVVGAGTVIDAQQARLAAAAGARFLVSPGLLAEVAEQARTLGLTLFPGVSTGSEIMQALSLGLTGLKLFPAGIVGGPAAIKAFSGPFPQVGFIPTGGVNEANLADYLALPQVIAVGGTWMLPGDAVADKDWHRIVRLAKAAITKAKEVRA